MAPAHMLFDASNVMLKAGEDMATARDDASELGTFSEVISGGGIAVRLTAPRAVAVPKTIRISEVEIIKFHSVHSLAGEWAECSWWLREDEFNLSSSDPNCEKMKALKRTWARVKKEALPEPLYAPRLPGTAHAGSDWDALAAHMVELHNAGKVPGLIATGPRVRAWPSQRCVRLALA
jgi:hypothetical protein